MFNKYKMHSLLSPSFDFHKLLEEISLNQNSKVVARDLNNDLTLEKQIQLRG